MQKWKAFRKDALGSAADPSAQFGRWADGDLRPGIGTGGHLHGGQSFFLREKLTYTKLIAKRKPQLSIRQAYKYEIVFLDSAFQNKTVPQK